MENFRVQFARRRRAQASEEKGQTRSVLFGAMEIIEDFNGTFLFTMTILVVACVVLTAFYAIRNL